jgi:hypothetical protein
VGCGIGWIVVRAKVGFHFDDSAHEDLSLYAVDEELAEQAR